MNLTSENKTLDTCLTTSCYSIRSILHGQSFKRQKLSKPLPVISGRLHDKDNVKDITILLDSGASQSIVKYELVKTMKLINVETTDWTTVAGNFSTSKQVKVVFSLPSLHEKRIVESLMHVTPKLENYDMILGRDLLQELGIILNFQHNSIQWEHAIAPMKSTDKQTNYNIHATIEDSKALQEATSRMRQILEAKYEPANLKEVVKSCNNLQANEKQALYKLLSKYETLFDGTLGHWVGEKYHIELKENAKPYHARAYPIPKAYEDTLKMEVQRLCDLNVLKRINRSEWGSPTFIIPKKDGTVRFISDFRELNKLIKRKPFPLPKIQDLLLKLEGFKYATSLDLNMGYYHIELSPDSKKLCTIVLPWGKYEYQRLPMGLCNSPDIFQEKMNILMGDLEYVRAYIDDLLILTKGSLIDHLNKLEEVLARLQKAGLKVNAKKSFFAQEELEYLGYWITRKGIQPCQSKVTAIQQIAAPKTRKELRKFIGMVNYYRDMWIRRSDVLAPLAALTSKTTPWKWTEKHNEAFETMKRIVSKETLLTYPNFEIPFEIYTDASKTQLGAVICQNNKPIAFYSRKLNPAQTRYTTTERELLAIVETLKEFRNILLGQKIIVFTDHQNLTYKNFNTDRVMRWRLILEEFGPALNYIKGEKNIVADALSRLELNDSKNSNDLAMLYGLDDRSIEYPLTFTNIRFHQQTDSTLRNEAASNPKYHLKSFHGGGKQIMLICMNNKIVIPKTLQKTIVSWYHTQLCHPGETRTEQSIRQHFWFKNLREVVHDVCNKCITCQRTKINFQKYGHLPAKKAESEPWEIQVHIQLRDKEKNL